MSEDAFTAAYREALALAPAHQVAIDTIEIRHPAIAESVFLVRDVANRQFTLETGQTVVFKACAFEVSLPGTQPEASITICNVDRRLTEFAELAVQSQYPVEVWFRPYFLSDPSTPAMNPPLVMFLNAMSVNLMEVTGTASFMDLRNRKFPAPGEYYSPERFPGL